MNTLQWLVGLWHDNRDALRAAWPVFKTTFRERRALRALIKVYNCHFCHFENRLWSKRMELARKKRDAGKRP